jgi:hypothetical protein
MNWIRTLFVRAKHWQIFLLFVAIFAIGEWPILGYATSAARSPEGFAEAFVVLEIATAVSALCYLLWLWSMGSFLHSLAQPVLRLRIGVFSLTVIFTSLYVFGFVALFQTVSPIAFGVIIPLLCSPRSACSTTFISCPKAWPLPKPARARPSTNMRGRFFCCGFTP